MQHNFKPFDVPRESASRRRKWTEDEDRRLVDLVARFGLDNWRAVGQQMGQRDAKQCRERYLNHLDPTVKKGKLTLREWKMLIDAHDRMGNKWSDIAQLLPGRTPNTLKNFWHSNLRSLAIKELFGTEAYSQGSRTSRFNPNDKVLEEEFMADAQTVTASIVRSRSPSPDRMQLEDDDESSVSTSHSVSKTPSKINAPFAPLTFFPSPSTPMAPTSMFLPQPMVLEEKKPLASHASAGPLPHIWDALVETAMSEYSRERTPFASQQPSIFQPTMMPSGGFFSSPMAPMQQSPFGMPSMNMNMGMNMNMPNMNNMNSLGMGPSPSFDSGKGFQFWSH